MKVQVICLALFILWGSLNAASLDLLTAGAFTADASPQIATAGETVFVTYNFTPSGFGPAFPAIFGSRAVSTDDRLQIMWWTNNNGTGSYQAAVVACTQFDDNSISNGVPQSKTLSFVLPTVPSGRNSITVGGILYGSDGYFVSFYSDPVFTTGGPAGTFAYISIEQNHAPQAQNVQITNPDYAKVGQTLYGSYVYSDPENDPESGTSFRWLRSNSSDPDGTYTAISGATTQNYLVQSADIGRFLKFEVTPRAASGILVGSAALSGPSAQVTAAPSLAIDAGTTQLNEAVANDGSVVGYILVNLSNADFVANVSGVTVSNLPLGLAMNGITTLSTNQISIQLQGNAVYHEQAASILNTTLLKITIPADQMLYVSSPKTTPTGFKIVYNNNPVNNLGILEVGYNHIRFSWNEPSGLMSSGYALVNYRVFKDNVLMNTVAYVPGSGGHICNDYSAITGVSHVYTVVANYSNTNDAQDPAATIEGTAMAITAYSFPALGVNGTIDHALKLIDVIVPAGTNLNALVASFTAPGATSVQIAGVNQVSGVTPNNFSNSATVPVPYTLYSDDFMCVYGVRVFRVLTAPLLQAGNLTTTSFQGRWEAVSGAIGYQLDAATDAGFSSFLPGFQELNIGNVTSFVINALSADTQYFYRVRALGALPGMNSAYSLTGQPHTLPVGPGTGNTEINGSDPTPVNMGVFTWGIETVTPAFTADPLNFLPAANNILNVSMSYGIDIEGLQYNLSFDNPSFGKGTYTMSFAGLSYDPREVGYRVGNGPIIWVPGGIDIVNRLFSITLNLNLGTKGAYNVQLVANNGSEPTLPVVLSSFTAIPNANGYVRIKWITQSETNVQGFYVLRWAQDDFALAETVSPMIEATNSSAAVEYSWDDMEVEPGLYYYWLESLDLDGSTSFFGPVSVVLGDNPEEPSPSIPLKTQMRRAFPNPFNPNITIQYDIAVESPVTITIYNARGQKVKTILQTTKIPGTYTTSWDGRDESGRPAATGVYVIRMQANRYDKLRKVTLVK